MLQAKNYILLLLMVMSLSVAAQKKGKDKAAENKKETTPKVENMKDIIDNHQKRVIIEGVYTQVDIRKSKDNPPVQFKGHVCIRLKDNTQVFVYPPTSPEAIRHKREIKEMNGHEVRIVGMIYKHMPQSDAVNKNLPQQIISSPYITYIEKIELVNPEVNKRRR